MHRLGVDGRPQSASGQTTILTGVNAPAAIGHHKQGFPNQALLDIIRERSIFLQLKRAGVYDITFANTYTKKFFEERPRWISATTAAVEAAGLRFNVVDDLKAGRAVYQDFTNSLLIERGEKVDLRTPEEAGAVLARIVAANGSRSTSISSQTKSATRRIGRPPAVCCQCSPASFVHYWRNSI